MIKQELKQQERWLQFSILQTGLIHTLITIKLRLHACIQFPIYPIFSAYYPVFRSMFRNVVSALNEAQDITLFLMPLAKHFEVSRKLRRCGVFIKTF